MCLPDICQPLVRQNAGYLSLESGQDSCHRPVRLIVTKHWVFAAYVAAKVLETFDKPILGLGHVLSGHTLKHVAAAIAAVVVMRMLWVRQIQGSPALGSG
jgi:hypothetical protein